VYVLLLRESGRAFQADKLCVLRK